MIRWIYQIESPQNLISNSKLMAKNQRIMNKNARKGFLKFCISGVIWVAGGKDPKCPDILTFTLVPETVNSLVRPWLECSLRIRMHQHYSFKNGIRNGNWSLQFECFAQNIVLHVVTLSYCNFMCSNFNLFCCANIFCRC